MVDEDCVVQIDRCLPCSPHTTFSKPRSVDSRVAYVWGLLHPYAGFILPSQIHRDPGPSTVYTVYTHPLYSGMSPHRVIVRLPAPPASLSLHTPDSEP